MLSIAPPNGVDPFTPSTSAEPVTATQPTTAVAVIPPDPCAAIPNDLEHAVELDTCRYNEKNKISQPAAVPPAPDHWDRWQARRVRASDDELPPLHASSRKYRYNEDLDRAIELQNTGGALIVVGVVTLITSVVLQVGGGATYSNAIKITDIKKLQLGKRMIIAGLILFPASHGLIIPGAFMRKRGQNLERSLISFGATSVRLKF